MEKMTSINTNNVVDCLKRPTNPIAGFSEFRGLYRSEEKVSPPEQVHLSLRHFLSLIKHLNISVNDFYNKEMRLFTWCIENQSINILIHCFLGQSILNVYMPLWLDFKLFKAETTVNISFSPTHLPVGIKCTLSQWFFHSRANALYYSRNNTFLIR